MRIQSFCRSASKSARGRLRAAGLAITTMSQAGNRACASRKLARICRLRRLRSTASAACLREMARPSRGWSRLPAQTTAVSSGVVSRRPLLNTRSKSAGFSRRARRVKRKGAQPAARCRLQTGVRRARPLARRRASTLRPPTVAMRARKPWVRLRRSECGWKVRFMASHHQQQKRARIVAATLAREQAGRSRRSATLAVDNYGCRG